jgi:hypothetical protein
MWSKVSLFIVSSRLLEEQNLRQITLPQSVKSHQLSSRLAKSDLKPRSCTSLLRIVSRQEWFGHEKHGDRLVDTAEVPHIADGTTALPKTSLLRRFPVDGLNNMIQRVPSVVAKPQAEAAVYILNWLSTTGTGILISAIIAGKLIGASFRAMLDVYWDPLIRVRYSLRCDASTPLHDPLLRARRNTWPRLRANRNPLWRSLADCWVGSGYTASNCAVLQPAAHVLRAA